MNGENVEENSTYELKKRMKEIIEPDMYEDDSIFYRFLKARDFNINQAEKMLKNHLEWRKKNDIKNIHKIKQPEVLTKYMYYEVLGYDKEGSPVRYVPVGNIDWLGILYAVKDEGLMKKMIAIDEEDVQLCRKMSKKLGKTVDKCIHIADFSNLSLAAATNKRLIMFTISAFIMYQNNYPETLKASYVINASMYFVMAFSVIKQCLTSSVLSKLKIYSDDSYKEDLLQIIDADVLPAFLGGTRTDPDRNLMPNTLIYHCVLIPESYYTHKSKRLLSSKPEVRKVTISKTSLHEVTLDVMEPGLNLEWEFETRSGDIGFGLFYQKKSSDGENMKVELIPVSRVNTKEYAETGLYLCNKAGTYVVVFDNTYSWLRSKEIFYRIKLVKPEKEESQE